MKLTDLIVKHFGSDKVMHFFRWCLDSCSCHTFWMVGSVNWFYHCNAIKFCKRTMA